MDRFIGTLLLTAALVGTASEAAPPSRGPNATRLAERLLEVQIDHPGNRAVGRDAHGRLRWSTPLAGGLGRVRPPHLACDAERAYVSHRDGVTALERSTGKILWHAKGPNDRLFLTGKLLLAADCEAGEGGRWLVARAVASGKEVFRVRLPLKDFDPNPIQEVGDLFLVQSTEDPRGKGLSLLIDRKGRVRHRFDRQVVDGLGQGIFLTSRDVIRLSAGGKVLWRVPLKHQWIAGGGLQRLPGGDVVAFLHGRISDSGVEVVRFHPVTGRVVWRARCAPLGVGHSEYSHRVAVAVEGERARVTSRGSSGTFVEVLDLRSGRQLRRTRK
jgi:outer membrane protein assembly factor BamB